VSSDALIDAYDAALFDLDGVVYLGAVAVPGAAEGIAGLRNRGVRVGFVTNNANRPPRVVAEHLRELGISAEDIDVVTSAQAAAHLLSTRFGAGAHVLAVGGVGVWDALHEAGLVGVRSAEERPVAVMQGWGADLTWNDLNEAAVAIHRGAHWVATNTDLTRPTDRGIVPGNGAAVAAVRMAVDSEPEVAGKPYRPLMDETVQRLGAARPIFVGDRLDTDIAGAQAAGLDSLLVFTGAHSAGDLLLADPLSRPTHLGFDLRDLLAAPRSITLPEEGADNHLVEASCGDQTARLENDRLTIPSRIENRSQAVDATWAAAQLSWGAIDAGRAVDVQPVVDAVVPALTASG
jgi:glycerol-1-phosphatase